MANYTIELYKLINSFGFNVFDFDYNFYLYVLCNFVNSYKDIIPKETKMIIMPEFMSIDAMNKEEFRMFLDSAEEFYKTL